MKKISPLIFVLVGSALLITAVVFWIDTKTSAEPTSFGQSLRDWLTLLIGLGASIKGWIDLFKKEKLVTPTTHVDINSKNQQINTGENSKNINADIFIETQIIQRSVETHDDYSNIQLTLEQEKTYLEKYLSEVERSTRKLPWGYALSAISPDLEISQIYVSPSFAHQENQRTVPVIMDEKQERDQERREKKIIFRNASIARPVMVDIYELIRSKNPVSIVGYMGTGKSLTANYLAWVLAKREHLELLGFSHPKTPIIIKLGDQSVLESSNLENSIFEIAAKRFPINDKAKVIKVLKGEWKKGNIVLILDALDEYVGKLDRIKNEIEYLVETATPGNQIILTSRPSMYRLIKPAGFKTYELNEIETDTLDRYIAKWAEALLSTSDKSGISVESHINFLKNQISNHPLVEDMVSNPLLLTILVALSLTEDGIDLSEVKNETDLYSQYIRYIINREKSKPSFIGSDNISELLLRVAYGYAGLLVHTARTRQNPEFPDFQCLVKEISKTHYFSDIPNNIAVTEACLGFWEKAGLFVDKENMDHKIGFRHQAFQFFGAASGLDYLSDKKREKLLTTVGDDPLWFDVLRLYLGIKPASEFKLE